jgi:hypothetical protein
VVPPVADIRKREYLLDGESRKLGRLLQPNPLN